MATNVRELTQIMLQHFHFPQNKMKLLDRTCLHVKKDYSDGLSLLKVVLC